MSIPKEEHPRPKLTPEEIREIVGNPKKVNQEIAVFRREARDYDPMPDKTLILGRQTPIRKAA